MLLFLHLRHPRGLFVLEQAWTEPLVARIVEEPSDTPVMRPDPLTEITDCTSLDHTILAANGAPKAF